jgi:hypothetical protein
MLNFVKLTLGLAIAAPLFFLQACSSSGNSREPRTRNPEMHHMNDGMGRGHGFHDGSHGRSNASVATQAKFSSRPQITSNKPVQLAIEISDSAGNPIANFETFHEKLMHLIVVSDNLQTFDHIHPEYKGNGKFEVMATFPKPGNYTLFLDYKPAGATQRVSILKESVPGTEAKTSPAVFAKEKTIGNTQVQLTLPSSALKAGQDIMLQFELKDTASKAPVTLQPYLGELGHLVIIQSVQNLTGDRYIHTHAMPNTPTGTVAFHTHFPEPGLYKLWGQFDRDGKIITADFWVNVE